MTKTLLILMMAFSAAALTRCETAKKESINKYELQHRITDNANILTSEQEDSLLTLIEYLESNIGSQIAILTIPTLEGNKLEAYSLRTAETTGIGRAKYNDGVLITVALEDRKIRIEVGTGLENILTDEIAARITKEDIGPEFKEQKFGSGLYAGVRKIVMLIENNRDRIGEEPAWK